MLQQRGSFVAAALEALRQLLPSQLVQKVYNAEPLQIVCD